MLLQQSSYVKTISYLLVGIQVSSKCALTMLATAQLSEMDSESSKSKVLQGWIGLTPTLVVWEKDPGEMDNPSFLESCALPGGRTIDELSSRIRKDWLAFASFRQENCWHDIRLVTKLGTYSNKCPCYMTHNSGCWWQNVRESYPCLNIIISVLPLVFCVKAVSKHLRFPGSVGSPISIVSEGTALDWIEVVHKCLTSVQRPTLWGPCRRLLVPMKPRRIFAHIQINIYHI